MNKVFESISHPDRRKIIAMVKEAGELSAGDIAKEFDVSKPTISHHLKLLTSSGLLDREKRKQFVYYRLNLTVFEEVMSFLFDFFSVGEKPQETDS